MNINTQSGMRSAIYWGKVFFLPTFFVVFALPAFASGPCPSTGSWTSVAGTCFPTDTGLSSTPLVDIITGLMNWLLAVLGIIALIAFVISGMQYLLSAGDEGTIETAKRNLKYSLIGVVVALSGRVLIMAINNLLNVSATPF